MPVTESALPANHYEDVRHQNQVYSIIQRTHKYERDTYLVVSKR